MNDSQMPVPTPSYEVRQGAMLCHLAAFLGFVFPFGSVVGPLILWQMKKELDPFIDDQGKEALNFHHRGHRLDRVHRAGLCGHWVLPDDGAGHRRCGTDDHRCDQGQQGDRLSLSLDLATDQIMSAHKKTDSDVGFFVPGKRPQMVSVQS